MLCDHLRSYLETAKCSARYVCFQHEGKSCSRCTEVSGSDSGALCIDQHEAGDDTMRVL